MEGCDCLGFVSISGLHRGGCGFGGFGRFDSAGEDDFFEEDLSLISKM